jgi:hypothetical protein
MPKRRAVAPAEEEVAAPRRGRRARAGASGTAEPPTERPDASAPGQVRVGTSGYSYAAWHARAAGCWRDFDGGALNNSG